MSLSGKEPDLQRDPTRIRRKQHQRHVTGLVLGFELVFTLGLGLVMTVQILTVQIKTGNHGTVSSPHFLAHVYCRQTAGWIKMSFGMEVRHGPEHTVLDGNPAPP